MNRKILLLFIFILDVYSANRREPRYDNTNYLIRQVRLSNSKIKKELYRSNNDKKYDRSTLNELNRRVPGQQANNVRSVVSAVKTERNRQLNSATLRTIKKIKESCTEANVLSQMRNRYQDYGSVIKLQRGVNQSRIDNVRRELNNVRRSEEYSFVKKNGSKSLNKAQWNRYQDQIKQEVAINKQLSSLEKKNASYDRAEKYLNGTTKVLNAYDKYNEVSDRRKNYLDNLKKRDPTGYKTNSERASEVRADVDYAKDTVKDMSEGLTILNDALKNKASSNSKSADKEIREMLSEFRQNPDKFNVGGKKKTDDLLNNLRKWDDNKQLEKVSDGISSGLKFTKDAVEKFEKAEKIIDTANKFMENQDKSSKQTNSMEYVSKEMKDGIKKYSTGRNLLDAAADYLPEGIAQETAKNGVKVMDTMIQAATLGNQIEEKKMQGGKYDKDYGLQLKDRDFGEDTGGLIARETDDGKWVIPDGKGGEVTISSEQYDKMKDTASAVATLEGKNPDQEKLAEIALSVKENTRFSVEKVTVYDDGTIEKSVEFTNANIVLSTSERDNNELYVDRYNQDAEFFNETFKDSKLYGDKKFEDLSESEQSKLNEKKEQIKNLMEATGKDKDKLTPNIMSNILEQAANNKKNNLDNKPSGFEKNMIDSLMEKIKDPNLSAKEKAELEALLVKELDKIKALDPKKDKKKSDKKKDVSKDDVPPGLEPPSGDEPPKPPIIDPPTEPEVDVIPEKKTDSDGKEPPVNPVSPEASDITADLLSQILEAKKDGRDPKDIIKEYLSNLNKNKKKPEDDLRNNEKESDSSGDSTDVDFPVSPADSSVLDNYTGYQDSNVKQDFQATQNSFQAQVGEIENNLNTNQRWMDNEAFTQQMNLDDNLIDLINISEATREQADWDRKNSWTSWFQDMLNGTVQSTFSSLGSSFGSRIGSNVIEKVYNDKYPEKDDSKGDSNSSNSSSSSNSSTSQTTKPPSKPPPTRSCSLGPDRNRDGICDVCGGGMKGSKPQKKKTGGGSRSGC